VAGYVVDNMRTRFMVRAYGARRGNLAWERLLDPIDTFALGEAVAVSGERTFAAGVTRGTTARGRSLYVVASRLRDGYPLWEDLHESTGTSVPPEIHVRALAVTGEVLLVAEWVEQDRTLLRAYRAGTGELLWQLDKEREITAGLATYDGGFLAVPAQAPTSSGPQDPGSASRPIGRSPVISRQGLRWGRSILGVLGVLCPDPSKFNSMSVLQMSHYNETRTKR
jgi:hypothetical protein